MKTDFKKISQFKKKTIELFRFRNYSYLIIFPYLLIISINGYTQDTLPLYSQAPLFVTMDSDSQQVSLQSLLDKGPVVITFYRGQWCPYCNQQMSNLQDSLTLINKAGATLLAITPEKNTEIDKTRDKSGASFSIIYDKGHKIMDSYKVSFRNNNFKTLLSDKSIKYF